MSALRHASCEKESKTYQSGKATITIHSNLVNMSSEERSRWFQKEMENENPILMRVNEVINKINMDLSTN